MMKIKFIHSQVVILILLTSFGRANATDLTASAGVINGTAPVIYNEKNEVGKVSFRRTNTNVEEDEELDISDSIALSWKTTDAEGDEDATLPTVEWVCTDQSNKKHVLASGVNQYDILPDDKGCTIGVNITPTTLTGLPRANTTISIKDISNYDVNDNIPSGPVNPHAMNIISYIVAPLNHGAAYYVPADKKLQTAFAGAQLQLETDNEADQLEWTTSNSAIAEVSDTGLVTIHAKGPFKITARHNEIKTSIIFNPQKFFVFSEKSKMNWYDAKAWCENQGYRLPVNDDLSSAQGKREVPSGALWQEWGSSLDDVTHAGTVYWSSEEAIADQDAYYYMYTATGRITSNTSDKTEGVACIVP